jgi:hypothetical protein
MLVIFAFLYTVWYTRPEVEKAIAGAMEAVNKKYSISRAMVAPGLQASSV